MCASARGKLSEILISGADCKSDRTSRVDERSRDGRGLVEGRGLGRDAGLWTDVVFTVDAVLRAKVTKINGRNYSALGKEKKKGFTFCFSLVFS